MKVVSKFALIIATALFATNLSATPINFYQLPDSGFMPVSGLTYAELDIEGAALGPVSSIGLDDGSGRTVGVSDLSSDDGLPEIYDGDTTWWPDSRKFIGTKSSTIVLDFTTGDFFVQALKFDVSAIFSQARIWIETVLDDGTTTRSSNFYQGSGQVTSYGLALSESAAAACNSISRVIIDPQPNWGISGVKIGESGSCAQVPEPGSLSLLGAGLLGLGLLQRVRRRSKPEAQGLV